MNDITTIISKSGLSEKASKVYLAALELGEASVQDLARKANLKRTTIYYTLDELIVAEALILTKRNKKTYYIPAPPRDLLKVARRRVTELEDSLEEIEEREHAVYKRPRTYFLYGPSGFKQVWNLILTPNTKDYRIITNGESFLGFVNEKYIVNEIISLKKKLGIKSKHMITESAYARKLALKDAQENRESRFLPAGQDLQFSEIIAGDFVAFISPRFYNSIFVIENEAFVDTRKKIFDALWDKLPRK